MASSPEAQRLTEWHRQQQAGISRTTALLMLRLFGALDPKDIDGTVQRWLELVIPALRRQRGLSAALAARYLAAFRQLEVPGAVDRFIPEPRAELPLERVVPSLMVTGPVELRKQIRQRQRILTESELDPSDPGRPPPDVLLTPRDVEKAATKVARAADRHVREGERETIYEASRADPRALGWMRVSDGDPCFFCAMLVSRGPVYRDDSFADSDPRFHGPGEHKVHDGCGCSLEPVYTRVQRPDALQDYANAVWIDATRNGASGSKAILEFRRRWEGRNGS